VKGRQKRAKGKSLINRGFMREAHEDLQESKQLIRDLLIMRQEVFKGNKKNKEQLDETREKAIDAINNLFSDELGEGDESQ
jgi:hypothetical protein